MNCEHLFSILESCGGLEISRFSTGEYTVKTRVSPNKNYALDYLVSKTDKELFNALNNVAEIVNQAEEIK